MPPDLSHLAFATVLRWHFAAWERRGQVRSIRLTGRSVVGTHLVRADLFDRARESTELQGNALCVLRLTSSQWLA